MGRTIALNVGIALSLAVLAAVVALIVYIAAPNALGTGEPRQQQAAADQAQQVAAASDLQNKQQHAETTTIEVDANLKGKENESVPEEQQQDEQARTLIEPRASAPHRQEASSSGDAADGEERADDASSDMEDASSDMEAESFDMEDASSDMEDASSDMEAESFDMEDASSDMEDASSDMEDASSDMEAESFDMEDASSDMEDASSDMEAESFDMEDASSDMEDASSDMEAESFDMEDGDAPFVTETIEEPLPAIACEAIAITLPYEASGAISSSDCHRLLENGSGAHRTIYEDRFRFHLTTPANINIYLRSSAVDAYLILHEQLTDGTYILISENDNGDACCDARIEGALPAGTYEITAATSHAGQTGSYTLSVEWRERPETADQFSASHRVPSFAGIPERPLPLLADGLTDRQQEVQLGRWFHQQLFRFTDDEVRRDADLGLIGYNYYHSNWPSSVCRDAAGGPLSHGWDAQPYDATPAGRQGVLDWRTRSWHRVYSVLPGEVVYVDLNLGDIGIFDGRNTVYYKHLNEIAPNFLNSSPDAPIPVQFGDYLGRMGMRGTAIAPHLTLEIRAGPPPHGLCPAEGTATSPLPYLYRLNGGQ